MKRLKRVLVAIMMGVGMLAMPMMVTAPVWADDDTSQTSSSSNTSDAPQTNILKGVNDIDGLLKLLLQVLVYGLGAAAVLGVIISGVLYMTARDNEQQVAAAKKRLYEVVIGLVAWALMYAVLMWLIPGPLSF